MSNSIPRAFRLPTSLKIALGAFLVIWLIIAAFPLLWVSVMSFKLPIDAFASNPFQVLFGFETLDQGKGLSIATIAVIIAVFMLSYLFPRSYGRVIAEATGRGRPALGWFIFSIGFVFLMVIVWFGLLPILLRLVNGLFDAVGLDFLANPIVGLTTEHYQAVWIENTFYHQFWNSMMVTAGVVLISLTVGTLAGYGLARTQSNLAFWLLIIALIFRALPHSVLVTGYLPPFLNSKELLQPLWDSAAIGWFLNLFSDEAPTFYGQPLAVIVVLVSINQPFTIWMLRSFFMNVPKELDEAALVDGCGRLEAFRRVIMPVMWPGVITTGLFSFLLAYNDYLVTALLLDAQSQTMVPAITQYFNRETTTTDQIEAVAAAVSIIAPLFVLVMVFQKQIVSGLTQGAVKG